MKIKRILRTLVMVIIATGLIVSSDQVISQAATVKKSDRSKIVRLVSNTINYAAYEQSYNMKRGARKRLDFSKDSARKKVISCPSYSYIKIATFPYSNQKKMSICLFGTTTSEVSNPMIGDWGVTQPFYSGYKYIKQKNGSYKVTTSIMWKDNYINKTTRKGKVTFIVKRKSSSKYGFVLRKMTVRRI